MKKDITKFVAACDVCQRNKYLVSTSQRLLLSRSCQNVVEDRLNKYEDFITLKHLYSTGSVAKVFI